ncbi:CHC2 zinc finger domain-containing protein [Undibacterium sp. SXout20W]|uniref:CHC2 zinc finger domain-containing protein n=1 Tax=Undibacterium sp. SXout20W TaxID=3413051 RepID=UPI003BEFEA92
MSIETLLQALDKVKKTGVDKWQACCPAHDDKSPSLVIRELEDGRVILHCFALCSAVEILDAIGLDFSALYPPKPTNHHYPLIKKRWNSSDVLNGLAFEILVAYNCSTVMASGEYLSEIDHARLLLCASRLQAGLRILNANYN